MFLFDDVLRESVVCFVKLGCVEVDFHCVFCDRKFKLLHHEVKFCVVLVYLGDNGLPILAKTIDALCDSLIQEINARLFSNDLASNLFDIKFQCVN